MLDYGLEAARSTVKGQTHAWGYQGRGYPPTVLLQQLLRKETSPRPLVATPPSIFHQLKADFPKYLY